MVADVGPAEVVKHHAFARQGFVVVGLAAVHEVGVPEEDVAFAGQEHLLPEAGLGDFAGTGGRPAVGGRWAKSRLLRGEKYCFFQPQPLVQRPVVPQLAGLKHVVGGVAELEAARRKENMGRQQISEW